MEGQAFALNFSFLNDLLSEDHALQFLESEVFSLKNDWKELVRKSIVKNCWVFQVMLD